MSKTYFRDTVSKITIVDTEYYRLTDLLNEIESPLDEQLSHAVLDLVLLGFELLGEVKSNEFLSPELRSCPNIAAWILACVHRAGYDQCILTMGMDPNELDSFGIWKLVDPTRPPESSIAQDIISATKGIMPIISEKRVTPKKVGRSIEFDFGRNIHYRREDIVNSIEEKLNPNANAPTASRATLDRVEFRVTETDRLVGVRINCA